MDVTRSREAEWEKAREGKGRKKGSKAGRNNNKQLWFIEHLCPMLMPLNIPIHGHPSTTYRVLPRWETLVGVTYLGPDRALLWSQWASIPGWGVVVMRCWSGVFLWSRGPKGKDLDGWGGFNRRRVLESGFLGPSRGWWSALEKVTYIGGMRYKQRWTVNWSKMENLFNPDCGTLR